MKAWRPRRREAHRGGIGVANASSTKRRGVNIDNIQRNQWLALA